MSHILLGDLIVCPPSASFPNSPFSCDWLVETQGIGWSIWQCRKEAYLQWISQVMVYNHRPWDPQGVCYCHLPQWTVTILLVGEQSLWHHAKVTNTNLEGGKVVLMYYGFEISPGVILHILSSLLFLQTLLSRHSRTAVYCQKSQISPTPATVVTISLFRLK